MSNNLSKSDLNDPNILRRNDSLLSILLKDQTTGSNIKWGTDSYNNNGYSFHDDQEITANLITGWYENFIRPRADKNIDVQQERQRNKAEVFTPSWVIKIQVDAALEEMEDLSLIDFLQTKWFEITCGEGPYMVNRYDMNTGKIIQLSKRSGFMDSKFKKLNEKIKEEKEWIKLALEIYKASYGYEYQGDSLLLARENLMLTFIDNYFYMFGGFPDSQLTIEVLEIISLNVFQMDGLTYEVPYSDGGAKEIETQLSLFEEIEEEDEKEAQLAKIKLWKENKIIEFKRLAERNDLNMKFDVVIGNPPYNNEGIGDNARDEPIYNFFMDESYKIAKKSILITPGRFLFNAGQTPKKWNRKMLKDPHLKVLYYEPISKNVFKNTKIPGGVTITYYDETRLLGPIGTFIAHDELKKIVNKINKTFNLKKNSLNQILYGKSSYKLTEKLYKDYPKLKNAVSKNERKSISSNIYGKMPEIFSDNDNNSKNLKILMRISNKRSLKTIDKKYVEKHPNLYKYKVAVPASNGSPAIGEAENTVIMGNPQIIGPNIGHSQTFISFGEFDTKKEADNLLKYLKTKFLRAMLGTLKVTQHNQTKNVWSNVPLQDFNLSSDINWNTTIAKIDKQLYKKYNLSKDEIGFIENNVKEME